MKPSISTDASLLEYQQFIRDICKQRGWDNRSALEKMLFLTEEVGELAKEVRKQAGVYGYKKPESNHEIAAELVDVLNYVIDLANMYNVNLEQAFQEKWQHNASRTWS